MHMKTILRCWSPASGFQICSRTFTWNWGLTEGLPGRCSISSGVCKQLDADEGLVRGSSAGVESRVVKITLRLSASRLSHIGPVHMTLPHPGQVP